MIVYEFEFPLSTLFLTFVFIPLHYDFGFGLGLWHQRDDTCHSWVIQILWFSFSVNLVSNEESVEPEE